LMDYLLWYNTEKPHRGLPDKQPPLRYLLASAGLELQQSNMLMDLYTLLTPAELSDNIKN
ncbi:MAG: hypothetical protein WC074_03485, partial [bacterium]